MSLTMILVPMAVAACATTAETAVSIREKYRKSKQNEALCLRTKFADASLLTKTLGDYGAEVFVVDAQTIEARFACGKIIYQRQSSAREFLMEFADVADLNGLLCGIEEMEDVYNANLQTFSYCHVKNHLPENMSIAEEMVLEDDSILITIDID